MEKTNKYYGIIENLVRNHKKFQGLDAILDDIIDDVYAHSEVIINSINNDSVIQAYLEKVVSTSIITVPKKMNFHPEVKHRVVASEVIKPAQPKKEVVNNDLVDRMINSMPAANSSLSVKEVVEEDNLETPDDNVFEELSAEQPDNTINIENQQIEESDNSAAENTLTIDDLDDVQLDEDSVENIVEEAPIDTPDVDFVLQTDDLDIPDETNPIVEDDFIPSLEENSAQDEVAIEEDSLEDVQEEAQANDFTQEEPIEELQEVTNLEPTAEDFSLNSDEDFSELENNNESEILDVQQDELESVDLSEETIQDDNGDSETDETLELAEVEEVGFNDSDLELESSPLDILSDSESLDNIADSITATLEQNSEAFANIEKESNFKPIDYSVFNFTPKEDNGEILVVDEVKQELLDLDAKHPELQITNVYNLKFKDKNSIEEITSKLGMTQEQVIEALNEMIAVV